MSLINRMLADLERRQSGSWTGTDGVLDGVNAVDRVYEKRPRTRARLFAWLAMATAVMAGAYAASPQMREFVAGAKIPFLNASQDPAVAGTRSVAETVPGVPKDAPSPTDESPAMDASAGAQSLNRRLGLKLSNGLALGRAKTADQANTRYGLQQAALEFEPEFSPSGQSVPTPAEPVPLDVDASAEDETVIAVPLPDPEADPSFDTRTLSQERNAPADLTPPVEVMDVKTADLRKTPVRPSPAQKAERLFGDGIAHLKRRESDQGEARLWEALTVYPEHVRAREILAAHMIRQGRLDEARELMAEGLEAVPGEPAFAKIHARILVEQGHLDDGIEALGRANPPVESDPEYHAFKAALLQRRGDHAGAVSLYRRVLVARPSNGTWWLGLAISTEALGLYDNALRAYEKASRSSGLKDSVLAFVEGRMKALRKKRVSS